MNAAEKIREYLGCYNIMLHKMPAAPKPKKTSYGANLRRHFDGLRDYKKLGRQRVS